MTLTSQQTKVVYAPDGKTIAFAVPFSVFDAADIECVSVTDSGESIYTSGFTVSGIEQDNVTVTFATPPSPLAKLVIRRATRHIQESDYPVSGRFPAKTVERDFDRVVAMIQELAELVARAIKVDSTQDNAPTTEEFLNVLDGKIRQAEEAAAAAALSLAEARKVMALVPIPGSADAGKVLYVMKDGDTARYILMAHSGGGGGTSGGYADYTIPANNLDGKIVIRLAEIGHPAMPGVFNPVVNLVSVRPYTYCITERSAEEITVQIYKPGGTPGVEMSAHVTLGTFRMGDGTRLGQKGKGSNVELAVSIPLPPAQ